MLERRFFPGGESLRGVMIQGWCLFPAMETPARRSFAIPFGDALDDSRGGVMGRKGCLPLRFVSGLIRIRISDSIRRTFAENKEPGHGITSSRSFAIGVIQSGIRIRALQARIPREGSSSRG